MACCYSLLNVWIVSTHSRAEAAAAAALKKLTAYTVSTHSRAEAAAFNRLIAICQPRSFNTQPRGGGCLINTILLSLLVLVSTHSRAEAAADFAFPEVGTMVVSTHSRAEAAAL